MVQNGPDPKSDPSRVSLITLNSCTNRNQVKTTNTAGKGRESAHPIGIHFPDASQYLRWVLLDVTRGSVEIGGTILHQTKPCILDRMVFCIEARERGWLWIGPASTNPILSPSVSISELDMRHIQYQGETLPPSPLPPGISVSPGIR